MAKAVKVEIPEGMYQEIEELVKEGRYRNIADFFYVAGQKELEIARRCIIGRLPPKKPKN